MKCLIPLMLVTVLALGCDEENRSKRPSKKRASASASIAQTPETPQPASSPPSLKSTPAVGEPRTSPKRAAVIKLTCTSDKWYTEEEKAMDDALEVARNEILKKLLAMEPPVSVAISRTQIRQNFVKNRTILHPTTEQEAKLRESGLTDKRLQVVIDVELTDANVQHLRAGERVSDGLKGGAVVLAVIAAVFGFLRLDNWSKGYLTTWLGFGALALAGAAAFLVLS